MAWMVRWELRQSIALTLEERRLFERAADGAMVVYNGCAAHGSAEMPYVRAHPQWAALLSSLTALRSAFPAATCKVTDDMGLVGWNAATSCYELSRDAVRDAWSPPTPGTATTSAAGDCPDAPPPEEMELRTLLDQIASSGDTSYDLRRRLERDYEPMLVARVALDKLPWVEDRVPIAAVVRRALGRIDDLEPLRDQLLALWRSKPSDRDWLHDLGNALESVASNPLVLATTIRTVDDSRTRQREKLEVAARLLGKARDAVDDALPVLVARARRDRNRLSRDAPWRWYVVCALRDLEQPCAFATLLLECASKDPPGWSRLIEAMVSLDSARTVDLAPRMLHLPEVPMELATALRDVRSEDATRLLRQLATHPLARVRCRVARQLLSRGAEELPIAAAIWTTLDAGAVADDLGTYDRDDCLLALGLERGTQKVDWNERIAALGMTPMTLPPLPDTLENLTNIDGDVRTRALRTMGETPRVENLLATALAAEVQDVMHRRWYQVDEYYGWYRWREASGMPGWLCEARSEMPQLVKAHVSQLPKQRMTPVLEEIFAYGAEWFADTLPPPILRLTEDERTRADEQEHALIARRDGSKAARLAAASPRGQEATSCR